MGLFNIPARLMSVAAAALMGLCFLAFGLASAFYFGPKQIVDARHIGDMPQLDAAAVRAARPGDEVLVYGTLTGNRRRGVDELVAYARQRWDVDEDSDGDLQGSWQTVEQDVPGLNVAIAGGTVQTTQAATIAMGGSRYSRIIEEGTGSRRVSGITEGAVRVIGFRDGDSVTVVGHKTSGGTLSPDRLYGGEPATLAKEMQKGGVMFTACGAGMICLAPIIVMLGLFGRGRVRIGR